MEHSSPHELQLRLFTMAVDHASDGIIIAEHDQAPTEHARISYVNEAFERMMGLRGGDVIGRDLVRIFGPEPDPRFVEALDAVLTTAEGAAQVELSATRSDGAVIRLEISLIPSADDAGTRTHVIAIQRDITEHTRTRDELERYNNELRRSNRALEEFASVASHDLQEPLRKIRSFGELLGTNAGPALEGRNADYLARMLDAAARMQTLINDLLLFSRITAKPEPFVPTDLGHVVRQVLDTLEALVSRTHGTVTMDELATIEADPRQMRALLQNLLVNALKFARTDVPPIVHISGRVVPRPVDAPSDSPHGAWYEIHVADNGIGFEEQYRERIFRVFQRLHGRGIYEGSGMGLAICRRVVEYHRGMIAAASMPGAGSTFTVTLPQHQGRKGHME